MTFGKSPALLTYAMLVAINNRMKFIQIFGPRIEIKKWSYAAKLNLARHLKLI